MPTLSIITAVYNAAGTIKDCIESVRSQGITVEHIIIDGGSTDGTLEIIEQYKGCLGKFLTEPDKGVYDAMNKGLRFATGDIIGILNGDDFYANKNTLSKVMAAFTETQQDSCYGDLIYVDAVNTDKILRYWRSGSYNYRRFFWGWMPPHPTFFVKKNIYKQYGYFNLNLGTAADYELRVPLKID